MQWRQAFLAEVSETLQQLGMRACPVCGSAESLTIGCSPVLLVDAGFPFSRASLLLVDAGFPSGNDDLLLGDDSGGVTFAVRVECTTCGHLMLFNAQKYRTGNKKIMVLTEEEESQLGE